MLRAMVCAGEHEHENKRQNQNKGKVASERQLKCGDWKAAEKPNQNTNRNRGKRDTHCADLLLFAGHRNPVGIVH